MNCSVFARRVAAHWTRLRRIHEHRTLWLTALPITRRELLGALASAAETEEIKAAFEPHHEATLLSAAARRAGGKSWAGSRAGTWRRGSSATRTAPRSTGSGRASRRSPRRVS